MSDDKSAPTNVPAVITEPAQCEAQMTASDGQTAMNFYLSLDLPDANQQCFILGYN